MGVLGNRQIPDVGQCVINGDDVLDTHPDTKVDLICDAITSISSLEMETTSSLDASLRNESYLLSKDETRFLFTTHYNVLIYL